MAWLPPADLHVLSPAECAQAQARLHALQRHWINRMRAVPFYTFGAATYLDTPAGVENYRAVASRYNALLREHFSWILDRVAAQLSTHLGEPVEWAPGRAMPGFHIYLACKLFEKSFALLHFDLQYKTLPWQHADRCDFDRPLSFTMPIALPATGGGMRVWPIEYEDVQDCDSTALGALANGYVADYHPYTAGELYVHSGNTLHQAAPGRDLKLGDERITLQGHGVRCDGRWQLYW